MRGPLRHLPGALFLLLAGCAALADDPNSPGPLPHGGTGEFRPLSASETGVSGTPPGRALAIRDAFDSGSVTAGHLFYAAAPLLADAPDPTGDPVAGEVDWSVFEPRRIFRSAPGDQAGFAFGTEVLAAGSAWEGDAVFEPWAVVLPDGSALLYYAAQGGIGVARAPSIDGRFSRVGDAPVVPGVWAVTPRRPSAVLGPDGRVLLYFEVAGGIALMSSEDGLSFTPVSEALDLGPDPVMDGSSEVSLGGPGAAVVETSAGRRVIRLYFESRRDDGRRLIMLAASPDGVEFERFVRPVLAEEDRRMPAPVPVDARTTLLYLTAPRTQNDREVRAFIAAVAPRTVTLAEP